jgi:hypothetical protein
LCSLRRSALLVPRLGIATLDAALARDNLIAQREEAGVVGEQSRRPGKLLLVHIDRRNQQVGVAGPFVVDLVMRDDLLLGLLGRC